MNILELKNNQLELWHVDSPKNIKSGGGFACKSQSQVSTCLNSVKKKTKLKNIDALIVPHQDDFGNTAKISGTPVISELQAKSAYQAEFGSFNKKGTYIILDIGASIWMSVIRNDSHAHINLHNLNRLMVDFPEAISEPHKSRYLPEFCAEPFFMRKAGLTALTAYNKLQQDPADCSDLFVEYGANMGALLANLDILFEPNCIAITGELAGTFDAWSHAMGKMRNKHRNKKPQCKVTILKDRPNDALIGAYTLLA
ncbi:MAG: hypothetical protein ACOYUZ_01760 [Patescibacteria group bacterium]